MSDRRGKFNSVYDRIISSLHNTVDRLLDILKKNLYLLGIFKSLPNVLLLTIQTRPVVGY